MPRLSSRNLLNYLILALFSVSLLAPKTISAQSSSAGSLQINPNNPHYFIYNDKPKYLITDAANLDQGGTGEPFNHKTIINITATGRPNMPYNNEDINAGWNQANWDNLRSTVSSANNKDAIIGIMFWSTPMLEACEGRWYTHLWNSRNGGPIDVDCDGKGEFYTFDAYSTDGSNEITESYSESWSWQKKNRFRQEELVKKYLEELKDFDNVYYVPMFEIGDLWGSSESQARRWHQHIAGLIKKYQPNRLVATVLSTLDEQSIAGWDEVDFLLFEGPGINGSGTSQDIWDKYRDFNKPLVWQFLFPGNPTPAADMREALINGMQAADIIRGGTPASDDYARRVASFISTVETWCDEPGQEITSSAVPGVSGGTGTDLPPGSCSDDGDSASPTPTPQSVSPSPPSDGWIFCANEYGSCSFSGTKEVRYGANGFYNYLVSSNGTACTNEVFGDPIKGVSKQCHYRDVTAISPSPIPKQGDLDKDGDVDIFDYNLLVANFGSTNCGSQADINGDCKVDIFDYNILLENFGV